jgi:hypothetical protein
MRTLTSLARAHTQFDRALVQSAIGSVELIFRLQHEVSAPRNEFMHLFINNGFLAQLGPALYNTLADAQATPTQKASAVGCYDCALLSH